MRKSKESDNKLELFKSESSDEKTLSEEEEKRRRKNKDQV